MKRIHLFEFEDQSWFPSLLRDYMTRYINTFHKLLNTPSDLAEVLKNLSEKTGSTKITDMCSGGGWLMQESVKNLKELGISDVELTLTDLYPNKEAAKRMNAETNGITYEMEPLDAAKADIPNDRIRTMNCSMHHMKPEVAKAILKKAYDDKAPISVFEISDNSAPKALWWLPILIVPIMVLFITPLIRPMSLGQLVFTYLIPVLPFLIAWDGAVSNIRTYTLSDLDELLSDMQSEDYVWEKGVIEGKGNKLWLIGYGSSFA